ncbi:MAG: hypothetical protein QOJ81_1100, partial [Chloroflexota bacterium]|nr:hypothetical protein [Chloroflexota bacterium]
MSYQWSAGGGFGGSALGSSHEQDLYVPVVR